jgi:hypothetical protein
MKKLIASLMAIAPAFAFAQFDKGTIFLGGTLSTLVQHVDAKPVGFPSSSRSDVTFGISPSIGFFLNEKIAVGASVNYSKGTQNSDVSNISISTEQNSIGISPYVRYYTPISNSIYFAMHGSINFSRGNQTSSQNSFSTTDNSFYTLGASIRPIFIFFPSAKWGIEASVASLGYTYMRSLPDTGSSSSLGLNAGSFTLGIALYFLKK